MKHLIISFLCGLFAGVVDIYLLNRFFRSVVDTVRGSVGVGVDEQVGVANESQVGRFDEQVGVANESQVGRFDEQVGVANERQVGADSRGDTFGSDSGAFSVSKVIALPFAIFRWAIVGVIIAVAILLLKVDILPMVVGVTLPIFIAFIWRIYKFFQE